MMKRYPASAAAARLLFCYMKRAAHPLERKAVIGSLDFEQRGLKAIEVQDFLQAVIESSKRTRFVIITSIIASVLVLVGLINSIKHQWMLERVWEFSNPKSDYLESKLGPPPRQMDFLVNGTAGNATNAVLHSYSEAMSEYSRGYHSFYDALVKSYVDNLTTKVPVFGFGIDANDLGLIGGLAFIVILVMYRFSLKREINNLKIACDEAMRLGQAREFYYLLAMHQVFREPETRYGRPGRFAARAPVLLCTLPFWVQVAVIAHYWIARAVAKEISERHSWYVVAGATVALVFIAALTCGSMVMLGRLDRVWNEWWAKVAALR
jgi:hypothetical protein